jgi:hypothetical protein
MEHATKLARLPGAGSLRNGLLAVFWVVTTLTGCHSKSQATHPEPVATEPARSNAAKDECVVPTTDALARFSELSESDLSLSHDIDFNEDGQSDTVVRVNSGREPTHLLYVRQRGCIRFLGKVEAFDLGCEDDSLHNGYCDLWVETWLMHGDRRRSTMTYVDGGYMPTGETELIPGPRDRPR